MTNEQVRKLLGGYATNSLSESERKALFDAAVDDQDLFNALQDEQALKELLADPVSRHQIQQALAAPRGRDPFWSRWWAWGGLASAAAAAVLIVAVIRSNPPEYKTASAPRAEVVKQEEPKQLEAPRPKPRQAARELQKSVRATPPATTDTVAKLTQNAPPPPPPPPAAVAAPEAAALRALPSAGLGGMVAGFGGPPLRYSLVRPDASAAPADDLKAGDSVRLNVFPAMTGYLSLDQLDPSGEWKRLYPNSEPGLLVTANAARVIPDAPIVVTENEQRLRLTLAPLAASDQLAKKTSPPLVIELTIGIKKAP
jgi:hypothetical protein